jgi:hypothetical protein
VVEGRDGAKLAGFEAFFKSTVHASPLMYDIDFDGIQDILVATYDGEIIFFKDTVGRRRKLQRALGVTQAGKLVWGRWAWLATCPGRYKGLCSTAARFPGAQHAERLCHVHNLPILLSFSPSLSMCAAHLH